MIICYAVWLLTGMLHCKIACKARHPGEKGLLQRDMSKTGKTREPAMKKTRTFASPFKLRNQGMLSQQPFTLLRLLLVTTALIFIADIFVMFMVLVLPPLTRPAEALIDGALLAILVFPTLYFLLFRPMLSMAKARKQAETALVESEERFRSLAETASDAIISVDKNGNVIHWNSTAGRMFGFSASEVIGRPLLSLLTEKERNSDDNVLTRIVSGTGANTAEMTIEATGLRKDGAGFPVELSLSSWGTSAGTFHTGIVRDITERKRTEEMLRQSIAAAEDASLAKTEFVTRMSHEIRTPVHGAMGMIDLTLDTDLTTEQHEYLSVARSSAESLLAIINDILDFSKIGARELKLEEAPFDLRLTIESAVEMVALRAHRKGLEIISHVPSNVPINLIGDAGRLRQVLVNLVGNAVKFTPRGEVVVAVEAKAEHTGEAELEFTVRDTGIGIPTDKHDSIFESFQQADGSTTREYGGTGLGLTISKQLVELMGGSIWLESESGVGSVFHFTVQLSRQAPNEQVSPVDMILPSVKGMQALIIDDNITSRSVLSEMLTDMGIDVTGVSDGQSGLREIESPSEKSGTFHLIFIDKTLPGTDSFAIAEHLRSNPVIKHALIMMLPSDSVHDDMVRCRELGIVSYLVKPVRQAALINAIKSVLGIVPEALPAPELTTHIAASEPRLRILLAEDNAAAQLVTCKRIENRGHEVYVARNGFEVLQVLQNEDFDLILMDVEMPGMGGLEAARAIRRTELDSGRHIPIIAMTAYAMKEDREKCLEAGMDSYVSKPVNYEELYHEIRRLLYSKYKNSTRQAVEIKAALAATGGDSELLKEAVTLFLEEDYPRQLRELKQGIEHDNAGAVKAAAHGIKGAVNSFGGYAVGSIALQLQEMGQNGDLQGARDLVGDLEKEMERFRDFYRYVESVPEVTQATG